MCESYIITLPIVSLLTALAVSVGWIRITRRYARLSNLKFQDYESRVSAQLRQLELAEKTINQKTIALRDLFFQVHHRGPRPAMASALGLLNLYARESKELGETLVLLSRPNHHEYGKLSIKMKTRMDEYILKVSTVCKELHENSVAAAGQYEHLQE